jgi:hypothetical protein
MMFAPGMKRRIDAGAALSNTYSDGVTTPTMGDPACYRDYCPECDLQVTITDEECPECGTYLPEDE